MSMSVADLTFECVVICMVEQLNNLDDHKLNFCRMTFKF